MSIRVCLSANTFGYPTGGGHMWAYLNWGLGLREAGYEVIWLESVRSDAPPERTRSNAIALQQRLDHYGLGKQIVLWCEDQSGERFIEGYPGIEAATGADLLLNFQYNFSDAALKRFRRTAMIDIDPGLFQIWQSRDELKMRPHDIYFTIGETVGQPGSLIPDLGFDWHYTPPPVSTIAWPVAPAPADAPFTTISHWYANEWMAESDGNWYCNDKRTGFLPYLDLPKHTSQPIELALSLGNIGQELDQMRSLGWRVRESEEVSSTPWDYQAYVQQSRGEFSCCKPSCVKLQNAWISDRTLCYLASGRPAVVQHTGTSRFLPDREGLFRFTNLEEAAECLEQASADYAKHSAAARALAGSHFEARKVTQSVVERALD